MKTALPRLVRHAALACASALSAFAASSPSAAFVSGDRWGVLGDSITHSGAYHREVELFHLTRRPDFALETINCGVAGDTAEGALRRLDWDLLPARPTVVSVMFGMNDVGRHLYAPDKTGAEVEAERARRTAVYERSLREVVGRLRASGARVVLVLLSPFDDTAQLEQPNLPGCGPALAAYAAKIGDLAAELDVACVDFSRPMTELNRVRQARDPRFTVIGPDRVHPGRPGHLVMAFLFLQAQQAPGLVSSITIDAAGGRAATIENAAVTDLVVAPSGVKFTALEAALPFPVDPAAAPALELVPFTATLNRQLLRVTSLAPGSYRLAIDDRPLRVYSAEALAAGINIAEESDTPQLAQARAVRAALERKWEAAASLRTIAYSEHFAWPDAPRPFDPAVMTAKTRARINQTGSTNAWVATQHRRYFELKPRESEFAALAAAALAEARVLARPAPHRYTLVRVPAGDR